jgi:hypothetical protein
MVRFLRNPVVVCLLLAVQTATAQQRTHRVDPRNMHERILAVVGWIGAGTKADPKRAMYTPSPAQMSPTSRSGIIAFQCIPSDDGKLALCEYVARTGDRSAFNQILADPGVKAFLKGRDKVEDAISEFSKHVKNFDINRFGARVP